jgi:hypothetical protein
MAVGGRDLLIQLRQRLQRTRNRPLDIEARFYTADTCTISAPITLRQFTKKLLNDKSSGGQEADSSNPRAAAKKYSTR